ncbi:MAG: hypothetical protein ACI9WU_002935 [Myxococcota bacterium]
MEKTANGWDVIDRDPGVLFLEYEFHPGAHATTFARASREASDSSSAPERV